MRRLLPFPLLGFDTDNDTVFLNDRAVQEIGLAPVPRQTVVLGAGDLSGWQKNIDILAEYEKTHVAPAVPGA